MGITMSADEQRAFLEQGHTAIITTLRRDGRPSAVPIWYVLHEGSIYIGTTAAAAKTGHLRRDNRCCFLVETGEAWVELKAIQIQAEAVLLDNDSAEAKAAMAAMDAKYERFRVPAEKMPASARRKYAETVVYRLDPVSPPVTWDNTKLRLPE